MFRILFLTLFLISGCATSVGPGSENLLDVSKAMPLVDFEENLQPDQFLRISDQANDSVF